ncbi:MAG: exonuclease domain-containing protein [Sulfurospirillum sp.]|jgi:exodeoxyribonuclease X
MKIIVLDTETTGMLEKDRICQLSYLVLNEDFEIEEVHNDLCMPPLPISYEAMAIHHITPEMLEGEPSCVQTKAYKRLLELNSPANLMVIQNATFDLGMLAKEGFALQMNLIDTFRVLRAYYPQDGTSFSLQYKRYQWGLYKEEEGVAKKLGITIKAHDALGDVIVLKHLFERLCEEHSMPKMILLCSEPIVLSHIPYGKNKGKKFVDIARTDRQDLHYMLNANGLDADVKASILHALDATKESVTLTIGFGKYAGKTPEEVLEIDRNYLLWMVNKMDNLNAELKEAIEKILVSYP